MGNSLSWCKNYCRGLLSHLAATDNQVIAQGLASLSAAPDHWMRLAESISSSRLLYKASKVIQQLQIVANGLLSYSAADYCTILASHSEPPDCGTKLAESFSSSRLMIETCWVIQQLQINEWDLLSHSAASDNRMKLAESFSSSRFLNETCWVI